MLFQALKESDLDLLKKYLPQYGDGDCDLSLVSLFSRGIRNHFRYFEFEGSHLVLERLIGKDSSPVRGTPSLAFRSLGSLRPPKPSPSSFLWTNRFNGANPFESFP